MMMIILIIINKISKCYFPLVTKINIDRMPDMS